MTQPTWWDFTIPRTVPEDIVVGMCNTYGDRWAYEHEKGEQTGYEHYQGRIVLKDGSQCEDFKSVVTSLRGHHSPTSANGRNFDYVVKDFVDGKVAEYNASWIAPWTKEAKLKIWQSELASLPQDDRTIDILVDPWGNIGKSYFTKWAVQSGKAINIPPLDSALDIMQMCLARPKLGWYIIDFPRVTSKKSNELWSAIEQVKNGYLYDPRYNYRDAWIDPPRILVFTNE